MKTAMKGFFVGAVLALLSVPFAYAQPRPELRDAGSKMRDEAVSGHEYLMYQRLARDRANITYHQYTRPAPMITPHQAKEAATQIRKDLTASDEALARLKTAHAKEPEVVKLIESIEKHHAKAHEVCGMLEEECAKEHGDHVVCATCCADMWKEIDAAKSDTEKLFKLLKIDTLEPPKKPDAKAAAKKPAAKK
jgi:hypothetical protein